MRMLFTLITAIAFISAAGTASATSIIRGPSTKAFSVATADLAKILSKLDNKVFGDGVVSSFELPDFSKGKRKGIEKHLGKDKPAWLKTTEAVFSKFEHIKLEKDGTVTTGGKGGKGDTGDKGDTGGKGGKPPVVKVPEAGTTVLLGAALLGITAARRSRREL